MKNVKNVLHAFICLLLFSICFQNNYTANTTTNETAGPQGYIDYYKMRRGGMVDQKLANEAYVQTKKLYEKQQKTRTKDGGLQSWTWRGPGNIGGRIRALAIRDNGSGVDELFAGSSGGGMLHSTDAGATWTFISDFLPSLIVTWIAIDPTDSNRMYASTGDGFGGSTSRPGGGILFSSDGGQNWFVLPATSDWAFVNRIAIDPTDPFTIYAVRTDASSTLNTLPSGTIHKSTNGGLTWPESWVTDDEALDIEINPFNPDEVLIGTKNGLYRSVITDNVWDFVSVPDLAGMGRVEVAYAPSFNNRVYALTAANDGSFFRSSDGGVNWTLRTDATFMGTAMWHYNSLFVDPNLSVNVIAGGLDNYRTKDGGLSFGNISNWAAYHLGLSAHADNHIFVPSLSYSADNPVVYVGNDGGVQRIDNIWDEGLNDWHNLANTTFGVTQFYGADAKKDGSLFIGGTQDNSFCFGSNGGNWTQTHTGDGAQAEINYVNEDIMYVNSNNHRIRKTTDGGTTWETIARFETTDYCEDNPGNPCCQANGPGIDGTPCLDDDEIILIDDNAPLIAEFIMDPDDPEVLYVGATNVWKVEDRPGGRTVDQLIGASGIVTTIAAADNGQTIWAGFSQQDLQASFNGGTTWLDFKDLIVFSFLPITDIAIDPNNSSRVLVSTGGYRDSHLYLLNIVNNDPNQSTATDISLPFPMQVNTVAFHPTKSGWLYIGTDVGIFASEDDGINWSVTPIYTDIDGEFPNEGPVYSVVEELFWYGDGSVQYPYHLTAATFGRGIWSSTHPVLSHIYIDKNYTGTENGTFNSPYNTLAEAEAVAGPGATIVFKSSGAHVEGGVPIVLDKRVGVSVSGGTVVVE